MIFSSTKHFLLMMGATWVVGGMTQAEFITEANHGALQHWFWYCGKCERYGIQSLQTYHPKCIECGGNIINVERP